MPMSPGTYLAKRRQAAGLSIEDVALRIETTPYPMNLRDRVEWLRRIETDIDEITMPIASALFGVFRFDGMVLIDLVVIHGGQDRPGPRLCHLCACSQHDACMDGEGGCFWVTDDLCSACAQEMDFAREYRASPSPVDDVAIYAAVSKAVLDGAVVGIGRVAERLGLRVVAS